MNEYIIANKRGDRFYYKDKSIRIRHREDGPAVEWNNGDKRWYLNDICHRMDGPAMEYADGDKMWFINGVFIFTIDKSGNVADRME